MPTLPWWLNRRLISVFVLGFASGLPLGLIGTTLQAWYTVSGASLLTIGWLTFVGQPYAFKFLWAPFLDRFSWKKFGRRRTWMISMQCVLGMSLFAISLSNPKTMPLSLCFFALLTAFFSATQDTAIDAYRTELLSLKERGVGVAMNTVAYRVAMIVSTSLALILAATLSWHVMYRIMGLLFLGLAVFTVYIPNSDALHPLSTPWKAAWTAPCRELYQRKNIAWLLIFIVLYKLPDAMALSLNTTFLIRDMGFSLIEVGAISKVVGLLAALAGSLIGGFLLPKLGLYRSLMQFGLWQALSNLGYAWLAAFGKSTFAMGAVIFGEYFCGGLATVAFVVLLMQLCDQRYTATQYALFSAVAALGRIFIGPLAAVVVTQVGWIDFYLLSGLLGLPPLIILMRMNVVQGVAIPGRATEPPSVTLD